MLSYYSIVKKVNEVFGIECEVKVEDRYLTLNFVIGESLSKMVLFYKINKNLYDLEYSRIKIDYNENKHGRTPFEIIERLIKEGLLVESDIDLSSISRNEFVI